MTEGEHSLPRFVADLRGWYSITMLVLGAQTGLLDAVLQQSGTCEDVSLRAGVDPRNGLEWLRALTAAGHVLSSEGVFSISPETAMVAGAGFPVDMRAVLDFVAATPPVLHAVGGAMRTGRGVDPATFHQNYNHAVGRVNTPTYADALVSDWINSVPGLSSTLTAGGHVADLACGNGDAAAVLGTAFPAATVVGFDLDPNVADRDDLPSNVTLRTADARALPDGAEFDLVLCLDSLHHLGEPHAIAAQVHKILRPGGLFLIAESCFTGDLAIDSANPFALIGYAAGLLYCLQENLAAGGSGNTAGDGTTWITDALSGSGFAEPTVRASETGYNIITAIR